MDIRNFLSLFLLFVICLHQVQCTWNEEPLSHLGPTASAEAQAAAVEALILRLIPDKASLFRISVDASIGPEGRDTFIVEKTDDIDTVNITGTTGVAAAWGFHHYLKYYCNCHVSWEADQLTLPDSLPSVSLNVTSNDRFRYYQNVCTVSYSFVWWNWERWQKEIDWMAMNAINFPLAFTAQEAIWRRVYLQLNLTEEEINEHFTGPAFFAWGRMGNMRGWGGPLSENWHQTRIALQKMILDRMREFGMIPILPAFAGHVPRAFKRLFPDANMTAMGTWNNFADQYCCPYLLDPLDPLFQTVGKMFLQELVSEFGTDNVYNCDTFNEMQPQTSDPVFLSNVSSAIFGAMTAVDPDAIWVMQGWLFLSGFWQQEQAKAFLTSVPIGRMIVLDLMSELVPQYTRLKSYYGQPFIWCMLHNFGGTLGLYGAVENVNNGVFEGRNLENSTMVGIGLTPEGINQNYVMYDFMMEMAWRTEPANLTQWFSDYAKRRYGHENPDLTIAWQNLKASVYNCTTYYMSHGQYIIVNLPGLRMTEPIWYNADDVIAAWDHFIIPSSELNDTATYRHDLVDISRQVLQILGSYYYTDIVTAYKNGDFPAFQESSTMLLNLLYDLDALLSTEKSFLLGDWLNSAKNWAYTGQEEELFEFNARNQITLWGPKGEIRDYANKQWAGVVSHYFRPRWEYFILELSNALLNNVSYNQSNLEQLVFSNVEQPFTLARNEFPSEPQGDTVEIAASVYNKWRPRYKHIVSRTLNKLQKKFWRREKQRRRAMQLRSTS